MWREIKLRWQPKGTAVRRDFEGWVKGFWGERIQLEPKKNAARPKDEKMAKNSEKRLNWKQRLLLVGLGVGLVLLAEGVLRLAGFGGYPSLLRLEVRRGETAEAPELALYRSNLAYQKRFFSRTDKQGVVRTGSMREEIVKMPKGENEFRVVFVGESTVEGFPMPRNLTSSAFLEEMLGTMMPEREVEVVNMGVTAIASFPIRVMALDAMEVADADAVVVYGAHNEFFGAGGVASAEALGSSVAAMRFGQWARKTGFYQSMAALIGKFRPAEDEAQNDKELIQIMAAEATIPIGDPRREAVREQLTTNWRAIAKAGKKRGIPVVLCTVASNEAGMAPMGSWTGDLAETEVGEFERLLASHGDAATSASAESRAVLEDLVERAPNHAMAHYALGRSLEAAGDRLQAAEHYGRARDLDTMPWRAAAAMSEAIREVAAEEEAVLADVEEAFAARAKGATDWILFDDHVHPSLQGQALLAETVARAMARERVGGMRASDAAKLPAWQAFAQRLGANPMERYRVLNMMTSLMSREPLINNNKAALRDLSERLQGMEASADEVEMRAIGNWQASTQQVGRAIPISYIMFSTLMKADRVREAANYRRGAILNEKPFSGQEMAARLMNLLSLARERSITPQEWEALRRETLAQARFLELFPGEPTSLTAYVIGSLGLLGGDAEMFDEYMALMEEKVEGEKPLDFVYRRELPNEREMRAIATSLGEAVRRAASPDTDP